MMSENNDSPIKKRPFDFAFRFDHHQQLEGKAGLVKYVIEVAPDGAGEMQWRDEGRYKQNSFIASFDAEEEELDHLYFLLYTAGLLEANWQSPSHAPVGIHHEHVLIEITCGGNCFTTHAFEDEEVVPLHPVIDSIRSLVPQRVWESLVQ